MKCVVRNNFFNRYIFTPRLSLCISLNENLRLEMIFLFVGIKIVYTHSLRIITHTAIELPAFKEHRCPWWNVQIGRCIVSNGHFLAPIQSCWGSISSWWKVCVCIAELPGLAFSRPENKFGLFLKFVGLEIFYNLLSSWPCFRSIKVSIVKSKTFPFLQQSLVFFSYKHLATLVYSFVASVQCIVVWPYIWIDYSFPHRNKYTNSYSCVFWTKCFMCCMTQWRKISVASELALNVF